MAAERDAQVKAGSLVRSRGLLIGLDENLEDVRIVNDYESITYDYKRALPKLRYDDAEALKTELTEADSQLSSGAQRACSRLRYDSLRVRTRMFARKGANIPGNA